MPVTSFLANAVMFANVLPRRSMRDPDSGRVQDLVVLFQVMYDYWLYRGKWGAMLSRLTDLLNCAVLLGLVFVFSIVFDWDIALSCSGASCANASLLHRPSFAKCPHPVIAVIVLIACSVALVWELKKLIEANFLLGEVHKYVAGRIDVGYETPVHHVIYKWQKMRADFSGHAQLLSSDEQRPSIQDISWSDFVSTMCELVQEDRGISNSRSFDELRFMQVMLMKENYRVALTHQGVLHRGALMWADDFLISLLIDAQMDGYLMRDETEALERTRLLVGRWCITHILLYPFIISFRIVKLLVKNVAEIRAEPRRLTEWEWSAQAHWSFALINEAPHILSARLGTARESAAAMLDKATAAMENPLFRFFHRLAGGLILILVFATMVNPSLLTFGVLWDQTFLWWLTASAIIYTAVAPSSNSKREYDHQEDLTNLVHMLHFDRVNWYRSPSSFCQDICETFLVRRFCNLLASVCTIVLMPLILLWLYSSNEIEEFVRFMGAIHIRLDGVGSIVKDSSFAIRTGSEESIEADLSLPLSLKVEKSIVSFAAVYPKWRTRCEERDILGIQQLFAKIEGNAEESARNEEPPVPNRKMTAHERQAHQVAQLDDMYSSRKFCGMDSHQPSFHTGPSGERQPL